MKKIIIGILAGFLCSCSVKEEMKEIKTPHKVPISPMFQFSIDESTQDAIAFSFAEACLNHSFFEGLQHYDQQQEAPYVDIVFSADNSDESTDYGRVLLDEVHDLSNYIYGECADNYLRLNVYILNNALLSSYVSGQDIYIVNALYRDALSVVDEDNDVYTASYKISGGTLISCEEEITENFANNNLTFILSFRDEITNWHHFSKGTQSYSDLLLRNAISFVGYGCFSEDEVDDALSHYYENFDFFGRKWRIIYGKSIFQSPCDDRSKHFCGLEPMPVTGYSVWEDWMDSDPYRTAWMYMDLGEQTQHVYVLENPLNLDLNGYDFLTKDMTYQIDDHQVFIPQQICYYNEDLNALCFDIVVD